MRKILLLFFLLIFTSNLYSQINGDWEWIHPRPQGNYLTKVQYINDNFIVAVGEHGTFIRSTNGGINWIMDFFENSKNILDIHFINSTTGFYIDSNNLYKTTNSGINWNVSLINPKRNFIDIDYDGSILRVLYSDSGYSYSGNLGKTWEYIKVPLLVNYTTSLRKIYFKGNRGYILRYNSVIRTDDNGVSWDTLIYPYSFYDFSNMYVLNRDTLILWRYALGMYYSTNGGDTLIYLKSLPTGSLYNASFVNNSNGFFGGLYGNFAKVTSFPYQWSDISLDVNWTIRSIDFLNEQKGAAIGDFGGVAVTDNGGLNWNTNYDRFIYDINSLQFVNENTGYLSPGNDSLLKTTNGGLDWFSVLPPEQYGSFGKLHFVNENTGWVLKSKSNRLYKTTNGGLNWITQTIKNAPNGFSPNNIQFVNEFVGFVGGQHSAPIPFYSILKTNDGGKNWEKISTTGISNFFFIDQNTGWIGRGGITTSEIRKTTNGGKSWKLDTVPYGNAFQSLTFIDNVTGYTCGRVGTILKSTNGGLNWVKQHSSIAGNFLKIHFTDSQNGFIGFNGNILKTINGGENWHKIHVPAYNGINELTFINENTGWIAGGKSILKTTNGGGTVGIEPVFQIHAPASIYLSQNYPNPFNPSTSISFDLPVKGNIKLAVYNIVGQEIEVLVKENLSAGTYQYFFNGADLPSGVYFYKLTAGNDFSQTKKMVMVK